MPAQVQRERVHIHRRKSSREDEDNVATTTTDPSVAFLNATNDVLPPRSRMYSSPPRLSPSWSNQSFQNYPSSAGPFRTTFQHDLPPNGSANPSSPLHPSFSMPSHPIPSAHPPRHSHTRTLSIPSPFSPSFPSPLSASFSSPPPSPSTSHEIPLSNTPNPRRHTRLHSRNLSVFFPQPNSLPQTSIAEDGAQELEFTENASIPAIITSSAGPTTTTFITKNKTRPTGELLQDFSFGARPPDSSDPIAPTPTSSGGISRRGHHHKHSLSHNFFSFLEPGADLHTQPTPTPISPWTQVSSLPSAGPITTHFPPEQPPLHLSSPSPTTPAPTDSPPPRISHRAVACSVAQFLLGARMWVAGQQIGALACTGLGYWVVFDAMGVAVARVVPGWLAAGGEAKTKVRRPYGNARVETVLMFVQVVYLMFASVYVCKEAVEHLLLSFGDLGGHGHGRGHGGNAVHAGAETHHHHLAEERGANGVDFPLVLTVLTLFSLLGTAFMYDNHAKLVQISNNHIPPISTLVRGILSPSPIHYHTSYLHRRQGPLTRIFSNPFVASPVCFCVAILSIRLFVDPSFQQASDLALATLEVFITFNIAYRACVVLGAVLLQTSPPRGLSGGRMEAFLRAMKEVERHPKVLHLPAPHLWQLTPSCAPPISSERKGGGMRSQALVATLELHVQADLGDEEVLKLTRWAWERSVRALGGRVGGNGNGKGELEGGEGEVEVEVTVGVVRG